MSHKQVFFVTFSLSNKNSWLPPWEHDWLHRRPGDIATISKENLTAVHTVKLSKDGQQMYCDKNNLLVCTVLHMEYWWSDLQVASIWQLIHVHWAELPELPLFWPIRNYSICCDFIIICKLRSFRRFSSKLITSLFTVLSLALELSAGSELLQYSERRSSQRNPSSGLPHLVGRFSQSTPLDRSGSVRHRFFSQNHRCNFCPV